MAVPVQQTAFISGEISPAVFGRIDVEREHIAATTLRNMFVDFRGGAKSRAGTAFVGFSKQTGRNFPPRLIPFQFSIVQGLALEFGHQYMRVIFDGGFVTETPVGIGGATQALPCVLTVGGKGATAGTPINTGVTFSYAPGDLVTLAGGTFSSAAILSVTTSELVSLVFDDPGTGYAVNDLVTLAGGTFSVAAVAKVASVAAYAASGFITFTDNPSDGDTITLNGIVWTFKTIVTVAAETKIGTSLAATLAQLAVDVNASANVALTVATYSSDPTIFYINYDATGAGGNAYTLAASVAVVSGGNLTGGTTTGINALTINTAGVFSVLPTDANMTQSATSGGGTGASFQAAVFGPHAVTISSPGVYSVTPANPVAQDTTTGIGFGATFTMTFANAAVFHNDDWIFISGVVGMTELNGNTYRVANATATTVSLKDIYGNDIDSTMFAAYVSGGTAARVFTLVTVYGEQDLPYLKYTQSADVMTLCCVNQKTGAEYPPKDLSRISDANWVFSDVVGVATVGTPGNQTAGITLTTDLTTYYAYEITAVSPVDGTESSPPANPTAKCVGVDIGTQLAQVDLRWSVVPKVKQYNIYKAEPSLNSPVPTGSLFGYIGSAYGLQFNDKNLIPDYAQVPPRHLNPFARGQVTAVTPRNGGSGYTSATVHINTSTGSGAVIATVVELGHVLAYIVIDPGKNYAASDTVTINGTGHGATATLSVGPQTGTYPSVPGYFQERRVYASTLNLSDTYFMSQPGAFNNFDSRIPPIDTDAIIGSPWSLQVNGIQWLVNTSGGLLVLTGSSAWLLVGSGSFATNVQPISPASQDDVPQAFSGTSPIVPPIKINYDVIYVNSEGSYYYALPYQLYVLSEPIDITELSSHLFTGYQVTDNAWCEHPYKLVWAVRNDGALLSLTYYKSQAVAGWGRHDTQGYFVDVCHVVEPPVDALYVATQRFLGTNTAYMIERMDDRIWASVEDVFAVDAGLSLPMPTPNANLTASSARGLGACTGVTSLVGGTGYSAGTTAAVVDDNGSGPGTGAVPSLTIVAGVITSVTFAAQGTGYRRPALVFYDPANTGSGASAHVTLDTSATFHASSATFVIGDVGSVLRMGGGIATITHYTDNQNVTAMITTPITSTIPNTTIPRVAMPGAWSKTAPVTRVTGLEHLVGATVTGLVDGNVVTPRVVGADGSVTLDAPATAITLGLGFRAQLQGVYFEAGSPTVQGQRKKAAAANVLVEASRGIRVGGAQPDGSTLSPVQIAPEWSNLTDMPDLVPPPYNSSTAPLYTGYNRVPVTAGFNKTGQVALSQDFPLPMNIVSVVSEVLEGDSPDQMASKAAERRGGQQAGTAGPPTERKPVGPIIPPGAIASGGR